MYYMEHGCRKVLKCSFRELFFLISPVEHGKMQMESLYRWNKYRIFAAYSIKNY